MWTCDWLWFWPSVLRTKRGRVWGARMWGCWWSLPYQSPPIKARPLQRAVMVSSNDQRWSGGQRERYKGFYGLPVGNLCFKLLSKWNRPVVSSAQVKKNFVQTSWWWAGTKAGRATDTCWGLIGPCCSKWLPVVACLLVCWGFPALLNTQTHCI